MSTAYFYLALLLVVSWSEINSETFTEDQRFDDYFEILRAPLSIRAKVRTVNAVWAEIRGDYANDVKKTTTLYREVTKLLDSDIAYESISDLQQQLRRVLMTKTAPKLADVFKNHDEALEWHTYLNNNLDLNLLKAIYTKALDDLLLFEDPLKLATHVYYIYHQDNANAKSLALTAYMQLYLLQQQKTQHGEVATDTERLNLAYYLFQIKNKPQYAQLDEKLQMQLSRVMEGLPSSLQYLFSKESFCLYNDEKQYLYTGAWDVIIDKDRRYVFIWVIPNEVGSQGALVANFTNMPYQIDGKLNIKLTLISKQFNIYWYLEPSVKDYKNIIAAWNRGDKPQRSDWTLQFVNDKLVFAQNGYLMCNSGKYNNRDNVNNRIYVNGFNDAEHTAQTKACQWSIGDCPP